MVDTVVSTNRSTPVTITAGDDYLLLQGVSHYSTSGNTVTLTAPSAARSNFYIYGSLFSLQSDALDVDDSTALAGLIVVGATGSVTGPSNFRGMDIGVSDTSVSNLGEISGSVGIDVGFGTDDVRIYNAGTIFQSVGTSILAAIRSNGDNLSVINHGLVFGRQAIAIDDGVVINSGTLLGDVTGLEASGTGTDTVTVVNSGLIQSDQDAIRGGLIPLTVRNTGEILGDIVASADTATIHNMGTIQGEILLSVVADVLTNGGVIDGDIRVGAGVDLVVNGGTIFGDVFLGGSADRYEGNGGATMGTVLGETGNDTLAGGEVSDTLDGGTDHDMIVGRGGDDDLRGSSGNDFILGGAGNDSIQGGTENDTLNGNAGDDTILGDAGNDILVGQDGSDFVDGGANDDVLNGQDGEDILEGGSGNDILRGGNGDDALAGGEGLDLLSGGAGADNFVFRALAETVVGANRDQILDFEQGADLIVVAGLSPGVFEFRGTLPFAPSGNPELRLFESATGSTIVQFDADGNGTVDAEIRVANVIGLTATDFVL